MSRFPEPCLCGAPDCPVCGPLQGYDPQWERVRYSDQWLARVEEVYHQEQMKGKSHDECMDIAEDIVYNEWLEWEDDQ